MINHRRIGAFIIELIRFADDDDIKTFLINCSEDLVKENLFDVEKYFYKKKLLNYLFEYIYGFVEMKLPTLPPLIYEDNKFIRGLDLVEYPNFQKDVSSYTHLYLHLYALCECYKSYMILPKNKTTQKLKDTYKNTFNFISKIPVVTDKDRTKLLKMLIRSYSENKFYYYFYDNVLVKLTVETSRKNNKLDYTYKSTEYKLQDEDKITVILNNDNKKCGILKPKLIRQPSEMGVKEFIYTIITGDILKHISFQDAKNAHKQIVSVLNMIDREICKCCNPDVKNSKATKICNNCKELFNKLNELKSCIAEWEPNDFIDSIKEIDFKSYVYKVELNEQSDIDDLRRKRKKKLTSFINKLEKEINNSSSYNKLTTIVNQLKPLITICFGE